jgi:hypothetical protein
MSKNKANEVAYHLLMHHIDHTYKQKKYLKLIMIPI